MTNKFETISPADLKLLLEKREPLHLIDVRTAREYQEVHLSEAVNLPLDQVKPESLPNDGRPIILICKSGMRGRTAAEKVSVCRQNVYNVDGGTDGCVAAKLSVVRGKKAVSLERQVRIAAGSLVLVGVTLSYLVHPACIGLSAFVGAGLVFAGVTDTCGMAMMLAKMPWNK
ncbi:MAG: rhodanese-like domain-containing protein [Pirellula sp.]|nr:rhodanese-like domain-containing protein [Pirellula sp.]